MDFNQLSVGDILTRMENMLGCYLTCQTKYRLLQCILEAEKDDITDDLGNKIESEFKFGNPTAKLKAQAIGYFRHTFEEIISNVKSTLTKTLINEYLNQNYNEIFNGVIEGIDYCLGNVEIAERILPDSEEQIVGDYGYEGAKLLLLGFKGQTQIAMYQPSKWDELITCFVNVANAILEEDYKKAKEIMSTVNSDSAREINRVLSGIGLT